MTLEITEPELALIHEALLWREVEAEHWLKDYEDDNEITHEIFLQEMKTLVRIADLKKKLKNLDNLPDLSGINGEKEK